jgi:hypothetical protein
MRCDDNEQPICEQSRAINVPTPRTNPKPTNPPHVRPHISPTHNSVIRHLLHGSEWHSFLFGVGKEALWSPAAVSLSEHVLAHFRLDFAIVRRWRRAWFGGGSGDVRTGALVVLDRDGDSGGRLTTLWCGSFVDGDADWRRSAWGLLIAKIETWEVGLRLKRTSKQSTYLRRSHLAEMEVGILMSNVALRDGTIHCFDNWWSKLWGLIAIILMVGGRAVRRRQSFKK